MFCVGRYGTSTEQYMYRYGHGSGYVFYGSGSKIFLLSGPGSRFVSNMDPDPGKNTVFQRQYQTYFGKFLFSTKEVAIYFIKTENFFI